MKSKTNSKFFPSNFLDDNTIFNNAKDYYKSFPEGSKQLVVSYHWASQGYWIEDTGTPLSDFDHKIKL